MKERQNDATIDVAAQRAGMSRMTAMKYLGEGKLPSEMRTPHTWRTRPDPFEADWPEITKLLEGAPELEAKALFEHLVAQHPDRYEAGQLRTLQRHVRRWRAQHGPDREVFFAQEHRPGEAAQTDFTWMNELNITIAGEPFKHMLCVFTLPYSNWFWVTVCRSESMLALKTGVQAALLRLGHRPTWHQTDNSTGATHDIPSGKREFNKDYKDFMDHVGMKPRTIGVGESQQNGDVEARNGAIKRRIKQHLLLRGSHDFTSEEDYLHWLHDIADKANAQCGARLDEELAAMTPITFTRVPTFTEHQVLVTSWSTIRVLHNTYSVPSRLIGERLTVRVYDDRIQVFFTGKLELTTPRLLGRHGHRIDYRHIIWSLVRKPGAFARYRYREELFPSLTFRRTYDALCAAPGIDKADLAYLRVLHLAASTMETEVETALDLLLSSDRVPDVEGVKELVLPARPDVPVVAIPEPELTRFDALLEAR